MRARMQSATAVTPRHRVIVFLLTGLLLAQARAQTAPLGAPSADVAFATSCDPAIAADFNHAVTLLHSFEYPESERAFRAILDLAPDCAMARWGVAMNLWHPLWELPSPAALEAGAAMLHGIDTSTLSPREAGYVESLRLFFTDTDSRPHQERARAYRDSMARVYLDNLDDPEAAVFYALSLLATADPRDKTYANQFKAAGLLNWVLNSQPEHPGALHYLIHSYDYPGMAHLALPAATIYAEAAPDSAHAQHMPSHIFTRLGLWDLSIASNYDSTASAAAYTERAHLPGHYDEGLHSIDYLMYALLQAGRDEEAAELLARLHGIGKANVDNFKVAFTYASAPARYALERRDWDGASRLELFPSEFPWRNFEWARSIHHFARGVGAARSGQPERARDELSIIEGIAAGLDETALPYWRDEVFVQADAVAAWIALGAGDTREALRLAAAAADREDAVDKHPVTPGEVIPARELLADMLLETGRFDDALREYRAVLTGSPNRLNALLGAARAALGAGDASAAVDYYAAVVAQTSTGGTERDGIREAREFVAAQG